MNDNANEIKPNQESLLERAAAPLEDTEDNYQEFQEPQVRGNEEPVAKSLKRPWYLICLFLSLLFWTALIVRVAILYTSTRDCKWYAECDNCNNYYPKCSKDCTDPSYLEYCSSTPQFYLYHTGPMLYVLSYIFHAIECWYSSVRKYLRNQLDIVEYQTFLDAIKVSAPIIEFKISCYHYKTTTIDTITHVNGRTQTTSRQITEEVQTFKASEEFTYSTWKDLTRDPMGVKSNKLTKLTIGKDIRFANPETEREHDEQYRRFIDKHKDRDLFHADYILSWIPTQYYSTILVRRGTTSKPFLLNIWVYALFSVLMLSWPYRMWFEVVTKTREITVVKEVSI